MKNILCRFSALVHTDRGRYLSSIHSHHCRNSCSSHPKSYWDHYRNPYRSYFTYQVVKIPSRKRINHPILNKDTTCTYRSCYQGSDRSHRFSTSRKRMNRIEASIADHHRRRIGYFLQRQRLLLAWSIGSRLHLIARILWSWRSFYSQKEKQWVEVGWMNSFCRWFRSSRILLSMCMWILRGSMIDR